MRKFWKVVFVCWIALFAALPSHAADTGVEAILRKVETATKNTRTLTADMQRVEMNGSATNARIRLLKPNYALIRYEGAPAGAVSAPLYVASDGKQVWRFPDAAKNTYQRETADTEGKGLVPYLDGLPVQSFFGLDNALKADGMSAATLKHTGQRTWEGASYEVLQHDFAEDGKRFTAWLYVGQDNLIHRFVGTFYIPGKDGKPLLFEVALRHIKINTPMTAASFAYTPPASAVAIVRDPLLEPGTRAPDFAVQDRAGKTVRLSDFKGKVVVLDFWATWCLPCTQGMKHTNEVTARFKDKGVVTLAINVMDSREAFTAWLQEHKEYASLLFTIDPAANGKDVANALYKVGSNIPTQYIIGKDGKISGSLVGYDGPTKKLEIAIAAALASGGW